MNNPYRALSLVLTGLLISGVMSGCDSGANASKQSVAATGPNTRTFYIESKKAEAPRCTDCGTITSIEKHSKKGSGSGLGAIAGAITGGVIGHQFGGGRGKDLATAGGAVGGGFAGNEIEKRMKAEDYFRVTVAMESGGSRTLDVESTNGLSQGSHVRVVGDSLQLASN
jgi:outer membrane lipoprotein SlyB